MTNTSGLDNRFQNLVKFVVQNDTITQISEKGRNRSGSGGWPVLNRDERRLSR